MKALPSVFSVCAVWALVFSVGCSKSGKLSAEKAQQHAAELAKVAAEDVREVRRGLPEGAKVLAELYAADEAGADDAQQARKALEKTRNKVQDLRVAKSTFFAIALPNGNILRNDQEQDAMAGKNAFSAFPALKQALSAGYVETRGSMPEAAGVTARPDGQWVAAQPVKKGGETRFLYVTGWSWSAYAYRLENALRGSVKSALGAGAKLPLLYVYVVVADSVYGAPVSPDVNAEAIRAHAPLAKLRPDGSFDTELEITGRDFAVGVRLMPELGEKVAVAVLRSET